MVADVSLPYRRHRRQTWAHTRRLLIAAAAALMLLIVLMHGAYGGTSVGTETIRVSSGDTVWSIASTHYATGDMRARVDAIIAANHLHGGYLVPGQQLVLPPE